MTTVDRGNTEVFTVLALGPLLTLTKPFGMRAAKFLSIQPTIAHAIEPPNTPVLPSRALELVWNELGRAGAAVMPAGAALEKLPLSTR
ncbi:MAG: hypothetical protein BWY75_02165 [bacterium ADurb.Bin425]|nr:MAG: hypothetical protein BWY75_02165 [bacterium ADurb.Bin425]